MDRTARDNLPQTVVIDGRVELGIINARRDKATFHEIPVNQKRTLQGINKSALKPHVGVAPRLMLAATQVTQRDIHTSDVTDLAIHDAYLTVVAVIHLTRKSRKLHRHERTDLHATGSHTVEEALSHLP